MAVSDHTAPIATPVHLWVIGGLATVWSVLGCLDFLLTNVRDPAYIASLGPDTIDFLDAFPGWVVIAWALQMGFGLLGSLLLLARWRWAVAAFAAALVCMAASQAYQFAVGLPPSMTTVGSIGLISAVWIAGVGLFVYSEWMRGRRILC